MSYAANLGRDRLVQLLHQLGAQDVMHALSRAILQSRIPTARLLYEIAGRPPLPLGEAMGPAESLSASGMALVIDLGGEIADESGDWRGPAALVLETYARNPEGKHAILELMAARGFPLPDTPPMAVHRGRIDLLEDQVRRDPGLLNRTFSHEEIYPPAIGCHADHSLALHGTPLAGGALLHLCVDGDELAMARWLLQHGSDVNAKAEIDRDGFGGHTPLFGCVVSQPYRAGCRRDDAFARLLLEHGADPNVRASLRKRLRFVDDESEHQYRDVTPLSWGRRFHDQDWVNQAVVRLITEYGGRDREAGPGL
jgi:hypothetical protein